ncbi:MAG: hypothetical protein EOL95_10460 [Bacteroidia bacterium]|nr:hypothetical protein [Bacteroidia bacterium]
MAEDRLIVELVDKTSLTGMTGASGDASSIAGGTGKSTGKGVLGVLGKLAAGIAVITNILWAFKPILKLMGQFLKMIGVMLQPLAETITLMLRPILILMRPIVQSFYTMLQPFMDLIRSASQMANQQASSGDIGGLITTSTFMLETILKPFVILLANTFGKLIFIEGAKLIKNLLIEMVTNLLAPTFAVIDALFKTDLVNSLMISKETLIKNSDAALNEWGQKMDESTADVLETMYMTQANKLATLEAGFKSGLQTALVDPVADAVKKINAETDKIKIRSSSSRSSSSSIDYSAIFTSPSNYPSTSNAGQTTLNILTRNQSVRNLGDWISSISN